MQNKIKIPLLILLSFSLVVLTAAGCYFIAEKFFFDRLLYQKSLSHGYTPLGTDPELRSFGERAKGILNLESQTQTLGTSSQEVNRFTIAVIGDSHVWGMGLRNNQRFTHLLEQKLNKNRPAKVLSYAKPGFNTLDYRNTINRIKDIPIDLFIILPVSNDALIKNENLPDPIVTECQSRYPAANFLTYEQLYENVSPPDWTIYAARVIDNSWQNPVLQCIVDQSLKGLPVSKTIFLVDKNYDRDNLQFSRYLELISSYQGYVINTEVGRYMDDYSQYFKSNPYNSFSISAGEPHPNALANRMYADILYKEIISNTKWGFQK